MGEKERGRSVEAGSGRAAKICEGQGCELGPAPEEEEVISGKVGSRTTRLSVRDIERLGG